MKNISIIASFAAFFVPSKNTVDDILSDLNKKVEQLQELFEFRQERAKGARAESLALLKQAEAHSAEAERAASVKLKIAALLS